MRNTYLFCDKCGVGHIHKLPRPGEEPYHIANCFNWDAKQYAKNRKVLCKKCRQKQNKK